MAQRPPVSDWTTDFDHTDPRWVADPYPIWDTLRQECPVAHTERFGGAWLPVRHDGVADVAYDTEHFTSRSVVMSELRPGGTDLPAPIGVAPPITSDPPFHALARRLLLPAFGPKPIAALEPFTRALCKELLDATAGKESFDAAVEYAQDIPLRVIAQMLGFPQEDADRFRAFIRMVLEAVDASAQERQAQVDEGELDAYIDARIAEHLEHPRDDDLRCGRGRDRLGDRRERAAQRRPLRERPVAEGGWVGAHQVRDHDLAVAFCRARRLPLSSRREARAAPPAQFCHLDLRDHRLR